MYDTSKDLLDAYRAAPEVLQALLSEVTPERAQAARGGDENWSVVEVVCHLRDAEERAIERTQAMRDEAEPFLPGYDQEQWARERNYAGDDLRAALEAFLRLRAAHIADLEALAPADWERPGRHEEQGRITIGAHIAHMVSHDYIHAAQIARQLG
ncbi:MAG TPA: DinB family protein [Roseiflexaceae bacterium]|nr:DinB family protein [Roseiflexaceae bacterium]